MGDVIHMCAYFRRVYGEALPEFYAMTDDEVIIYMLRPPEEIDG